MAKNDKKNFPTFAVIVLLFAIVWLFNTVSIININLPWIPVILIIIALGMIINRYQ